MVFSHDLLDSFLSTALALQQTAQMLVRMPGNSSRVDLTYPLINFDFPLCQVTVR